MRACYIARMSKLATGEQLADFGVRLAEVRARTRLNQATFAHTLGVSSRAYINWERGEREAPVAVLRALYEVYGINPLWMLGRTEQRNAV